jgi:glycosyltransferase involved in cell wall biosynthesis
MTMQLFFNILFIASAFIIFWAMIGYPMSIKLLEKFVNVHKLEKDFNLQPSVTVMIVAHNEEKVILDKLKNVVLLDYPKEKIEFLVASDNSTDLTNEIVRSFINEHPEENIRLYEVKVRKGKTNAQNEAQKTVSTEYLIMTDANSMLDSQSIKELMSAFVSNDIVYVAGRLKIVNENSSSVSNAEANYWDKDLRIRDIESRIQTITAGNGALYACRNADYYDFDPINSHDSSMPLYFGLQGKRAIANHDAVAYEKAGVVIEDEFKRKVRMNRDILKHILPDIKILNVFRYKWFSYFYFGHRTCRYLLWISHLIVFVSNLMLFNEAWYYSLIAAAQVLFYLLAVLQSTLKINNRYLNLIHYYTMTVFAQWVGVYRILTGKAKPFWEKAESTR